MNCNVSVLSSEIDVPKQLKQVKNSFLDSYSQNVDSKSETNNNMGVENTWTDDELVVAPIPDLPIPLPAPSTSVEVTTFDEALNTHEVYPDLDCLFSPLGQPNVIQEEPIFDGVVGRGEAGVCGLRNLGNTCFMGAGVQCLVATAPLAAALVRVPFSPSSPLTNCLADLTRRVWTGRYVSIQPTAFKMALASHFPQFNDFRQHDCQEFLALLLDGLHEQLNTASNKDIACQVEPREFRDPPAQHKVMYKDTGIQSTSQEGGNYYCHAKCNEKPLQQQLTKDEKSAKEVKESKEHPKKNNVDKSTHMDTPPVRSSTTSPCEPSSSGCRSTTDNINIKCDNTLNCDNKQQHLNNQQMSLIAREENNIPVVNNAVQRNNAAGGSGSGAGLEQLILKDNKTSNLNVLGVKEEPNNEIRFDSEKYSKSEGSRRRCEPFNVNSFDSYENSSSGKRCTNFSLSLDVKERLDLKRVKLNCSTEEPSEKNKMMEIERQLKSPDALLDKNERMECERKEISKEDSLAENGDVSNLPLIVLDIPFDKTSEPQADQHWLQHLASNRSVVVNTFQGQFKSTVVCSVCKYISVTYEPFMYLSVPLPNAMQKKLHVTYIGESLKHPTEFLLELNKYDSVSHLRTQIISKVGCDLKGPILIAEVLNHHIAKILEDHQLIRYLNDSDRSLYAFEVSTILEISTSSTSSSSTDSEVEEEGPLETSCIICLEDKEGDMKQHEGCSCILCESCIVASCTHYGGNSFDCPVCRKHVQPEVDLQPVKPSQVTSRMMNVPLVFRVDTVGDGNNNQKNVGLFGHPMLVRVPNRCSGHLLRTAIHSVIPYKEPYRLLLVDGQGLHCSRCMFHTHCRGCDLPTEVVLTSSDSLAITFTAEVEVLPTTCSISTLSDRPNSLSLYDCIQAFSQSELLDGNNPWYCPRCKQNRCATKTLSVWRYPDYLIVYLKRFVFHNQLSTKLEEKVMFPLNGLSLAACTFSYDLYACVCHIGGVSAGHYTTYSQHPYTGQWHYYNDSFVSKQAPLEEDYSNAYILFYKKQGLEPPSIDGMKGMIHQGDR